MSDEWQRLLSRLEELRDLGGALGLLNWDQTVMMPSRGAESRSRVVSTVEGIAHDRLTHPEIGELIEALAEAEDLGNWERAHVRALKREYDREVRIPKDLVRAIAETRTLAYQAWTEARPASDFEIYRPHLEKMVALKIEEADAVGWDDERYDALLDVYEPDMKASEVASLFAELVTELQPVAESILESAGDRPEWLSGTYEEKKQENFCHWLVDHVGFDFEAGRLDKSPHPFTVAVASGDTRQTIRTDPRNLVGAIYAAMHETGHALYDQGLPAEQLGLPAGHAPSLGLHESQSRIWENQVGRSPAFATWMLPHLKQHFEEELGSLAPDEFVRGVNYPQRSLIRVESDEVTYNLHIILRFELELEMFRGHLDVAELPEAWDRAMEQRIGLRPNDVADGVLQDVHWAFGYFGYFPTYTLGTLYAACFYQRALSELGDVEDEIRSGDSSRLLAWLREKVHSQAYLYPATELAHRILGQPLSSRPFIDYLRSKYATVFGTSF
jgi:carboxypeptidase Taq